MKKKPHENFEKLIERLEDLTESLEREQISLEESIKKFQEGFELAGLCLEKLKMAEEKVKVLIDDSSGKFKLKDFN